jgi:hypothetical protein
LIKHLNNRASSTLDRALGVAHDAGHDEALRPGQCPEELGDIGAPREIAREAGQGAGIEGAGEDEEVTTYHLTTGTFDLVPQIVFDRKTIISTPSC